MKIDTLIDLLCQPQQDVHVGVTVPSEDLELQKTAEGGYILVAKTPSE
jgi:hypothetical protein